MAVSPSPLDSIREWLSRYLLTVTDADLDLLALWAAHTHVVNETYTTPRLLLDSPVPGSGKTTCLEHLARLCVNPVQMAAVSSPALLARLLEDGMRTMLIDEADRTLRPDKDGVADLIAILNSGYKRGATRPVLVPEKGGGWVPREMPTFAPVVLAGNSPQLPDDTRSRTIRVLLLPDLEGRVEESDWELIEDDARLLGEQLAAWAEEHRAAIAATRPAMPEGIVGRFREKWQPLARVAAVAAGRWPAAVADMALADRAQVEADREDGMLTDKPHMLLLRHLAEVWPEGAEFTATTELVAVLIATHPEAWSASSPYGRDLTVQRFGRMLATHFKLNSTRQHLKTDPRGYFLSALVAVWQRTGIRVGSEPPQPAEAAEPTPLSTPVAQVPPVAAVRSGGGGADAPVCSACGGPNDPERDLLGADCLACYTGSHP